MVIATKMEVLEEVSYWHTYNGFCCALDKRLRMALEYLKNGLKQKPCISYQFSVSEENVCFSPTLFTPWGLWLLEGSTCTWLFGWRMLAGEDMTVLDNLKMRSSERYCLS